MARAKTIKPSDVEVTSIEERVLTPIDEITIESMVQSFDPESVVSNKGVFVDEDGNETELTNMRVRHPWKILKDFVKTYMEIKNVTLPELAELLNKPEYELQQIMDTQREIDVDWAARLSAIFDTSMQVWVGMQQSYNKWLINNPKEDVVVE